MKIKEFMSTKIISVGKGMSVKEFIKLMEENKITGSPVVDEHGKVIGVISVSDVIKRSNYISQELAHCDECYEVDPSTGMVEVHKYYTQELFEKNIDCLMTKKPISISPEADLEEAVKVFLTTPIHRILVMEGDKVAGIISTKDTLKALAQLCGKGV